MSDSKQLTMFEKIAAKFAPDYYIQQRREPVAWPRRAREVGSYVGETEEATEKPKIEATADVISFPSPSNPDHTLVSLPLVRHWLFAPDGTRLPHRKFKLETIHKRQHIVQTVTIGDTWADRGKGYGVLTTRHQRALFVLQQIWQQQGGRIALLNDVRRGTLCCSSWDLEQALFGTHGGREKRMARAIIQELSSIPVLIENYVASDGSIYDLDITGLLGGAEFKSSRRGSRTQLGFPWVEIFLSSIITRAFEERAVKPLDMRVLAGFKTNGAALLYPKLDYFLATHDETELTLQHLVERFGLDQINGEMRKLSIRKRYFEPVAQELSGSPLSSDGYVIDATLQPTKDGTDLKLVARRKSVRQSQKKPT